MIQTTHVRASRIPDRHEKMLVKTPSCRAKGGGLRAIARGPVARSRGQDDKRILSVA
jgi:hypothetical protein